MEKLLGEYFQSKNIQTPPIVKLAGHSNNKILGFPVNHTEDAYVLWEQLCELTYITGMWPVLLGDEENIRHLDKFLAYFSMIDVKNEIQKSRSIDLGVWTAKRALRVIRDSFFYNSDPKQGVVVSDLPSIGNQSSIVHLGFFPVKESFNIPAHVLFGGSNDCPSPHVHCALLKRWKRIFDADVLSITQEEICIKINSPPLNKRSAQNLSEEISLYCPDYPDDNIPKVTDYFTGITYAQYLVIRWVYPWDRVIDPE